MVISPLCPVIWLFTMFTALTVKLPTTVSETRKRHGVLSSKPTGLVRLKLAVRLPIAVRFILPLLGTLFPY